MFEHANNLEEAILKADHTKCEEILKKIAEEDGGKNLPLAEEQILQILNHKYFPTEKIEKNLPLRSVDDEIKMWKVLNKYCKKVNLENVTAGLFVKFWFEKPEFALELLEETIKHNNSFKFKKWISDNIIFLNYQYIPPLNNNEAFAKCLSHLYQLGFSMPAKFQIALLQTDFGAALYPDSRKVDLGSIDILACMHWDSKDCLDRLNRLTEQVKNYRTLSMAVENSACACVSLVLSQKMYSENFQNVLETTLKDGRGYMVYLLCDKDLKRTADLIFSQSDLYNNLVASFMFTPLDIL